MSKDDEIKLQWASDSKTDGDWVVYAGEPINSDEPMTGHGADLVALDHVTKERDAALAERDAASAERDALIEACREFDQWITDAISAEGDDYLVLAWETCRSRFRVVRALLPEETKETEKDA